MKGRPGEDGERCPAPHARVDVVPASMKGRPGEDGEFLLAVALGLGSLPR